MFDYNEIKCGNKIEKIIIMFHGYGSNKDDLINLVPDVSKYCQNTVFISASAPQALEMTPSKGGRQWFSLLNRSPEYLLNGLQNVASSVTNFIESMLIKYGLTNKSLGLLGFSQGSMLSLYLILENLINPKVVIAFSGWIFKNNWQQLNKNYTKILLLHGRDDNVVPFSTMSVTAEIIKNRGYEVQTHISNNLGHGIDKVGIKEAGIFLKNNFRDVY